jgi:hypothetical protein
MLRAFLLSFMIVIFSVPAQAIGINRFPFRPFDDIHRPRTAEEVEISYQMLVNKRDGIDSLEAKMIALHEMVRAHQELGYQLDKPKIMAETQGEWKVRVPARFSINKDQRAPDFIVCVDKTKGKITCFAPEAAPKIQ